ncbi:MAG TPA: peptidyl-prolyl cis-trans isomerase [Pseudobdellovibrionaceae bacterium]|nr:peptidyl-prolyl cis-trans isomerase [Pseudobdellovibrionaceae bacterium]
MSSFLAACPSQTSKVSVKPVIKVNDHQLSARDFSVRLARRLKSLDALSAKDPVTIRNAKEEIAKDFIVQSLIQDWMRTRKISFDDVAVDKEVEKIRAGYPDDLSFRRSLAVENLSFSEWRESLRYNLIERAFFETLRQQISTPTETELRRYFEEHRAQFRKRERIYIRQIVTDDEAKAELLKAELKKTDFAALAKKYSLAPEASNGGLVGWVEKGNVDFFDSAFSQNTGTVGGVVKSPFGYHLIKVEKKLPPSPGSFDEARPEILKTLIAQREQAEFVAWLDGQIRSSRVLKDADLIRGIQVETRSDNE